MGLFKKKPTVEPTDFLALRAELVELRERLDAAEHDKAVLEDRLSSLDASTTALAASHPDLSNLDHLSERIDAVSARVEQVASAAPDRTAIDARLSHLADDVQQMRSEVGTLHEQAARLAEVPPPPPPPPPAPPPAPVVAEPDPQLLERLDELQQRVGAIDTVQAQLQQLTARVAAQAEMGAQLSGLRDRLTQLGEQVATTDGLRDQVQQLAQRTRSADEFSALMQQLSERLDRTEMAQHHAGVVVADLDGNLDQRVDTRVEAQLDRRLQSTLDELRQHVEDRLGSMGTELANQISELGRDLDALAAASAEGGDGLAEIDTQTLIDELRSGQVRLANEQARYEIAFRQDLAALAEQLRRQR